MLEPEDGRAPIHKSGFTYLPQFITQEQSAQLIAYFGEVTPLWERRHQGAAHKRSDTHTRRLTRPVYWLGAWQFACLGYYAEPDHREHRCMRAEPLTPVMRDILERLRPSLLAHGDSSAAPGELPNTCLINYYGREVRDGKVPRDYARLRMHRDQEPGPVIMFCIGQPGLLEFLDPDRSAEPELAVWTRHRSITIMSGPEFKERLYHRVAQVRTGTLPAMHSRLANFQLRRISVSFRYVPEHLIEDFHEMPEAAQLQIRGYVTQLAQHSKHYQKWDGQKGDGQKGDGP